jgi:hypothetical protein
MCAAVARAWPINYSRLPVSTNLLCWQPECLCCSEQGSAPLHARGFSFFVSVTMCGTTLFDAAPHLMHWWGVGQLLLLSTCWCWPYLHVGVRPCGVLWLCFAAYQLSWSNGAPGLVKWLMQLLVAARLLQHPIQALNAEADLRHGLLKYFILLARGSRGSSSVPACYVTHLTSQGLVPCVTQFN